MSEWSALGSERGGAEATYRLRVEVARAALVDMGRPDLAALIVDDDGEAHGWSVMWRQCRMFDVGGVTIFEEPDGDDRVLLFKAAAIASLSTGFDEPTLPCPEHVRRGAFSRCAGVRRSEFVRGVNCSAV